LVTLIAKAFLNEELSSSPGRGLAPKVSLIQSLQTANSLIHFLNAHHDFDYLSSDQSERLTTFQLDCMDWENLISISSSLSR
jgi:hypothetical protein